ncbi:YciI family protein [Nakamurella silvestris]|nr:YciI family protein [Nakamurella silvestris]
MKYMLLIAADPQVYQQYSEAELGEQMGEYNAFTERIAASGELVAGEELKDVTSATTVRIRDGVRTLTDGPFAEAREQIGGFYIVDVASLDRALELAAELPEARHGSVEVRPVMVRD